MAIIGTLPGARLAGLSADLFHKLQGGTLSIEELALFVQRKNPFAFERNQYGHVIITITGHGLTGVQEVERLLENNYRVGEYAKSCFMSTAPDSYDANHRLDAGQSYKLALIPGKEIQQNSDRTTTNLRNLGMQEYGYGKPIAGFVPRIREVVSDKQMEEMGIRYIACLHDPIKDSDGSPSVLNSDRGGDGRWVGTYWDFPDYRWDDDGAFAFPVPAS